MIRKGFLEDGVVQAEICRLSGSEPKPETEQALPAEETPCVKARSLSKDLATLGRVESREAGRERIPGLSARLRGLPSNPSTLDAGEPWESFQQGSGQVWCEHAGGLVSGSTGCLPGLLRLPLADALFPPGRVGIRNSSHVLSAW